MGQSNIAGIILIILGLVLAAKPRLIWKISEKWKSQDAKQPSAPFIVITRILGGIFISVGIFLLIGLIK